jgi:hypothetical protein
MGSKFNMIILPDQLLQSWDQVAPAKARWRICSVVLMGPGVGAVELDGTDLRHLAVDDEWRPVADATCLF